MSDRGRETTEVRAHFEDQLRHLKDDVVRLAAHVGDCVPRATEALIARDRDELTAVHAADDEVHRLAAEIDSSGCRLLALQQPVASDLRALVTALRLGYELERIADLVTDAASTIEGPPHDIGARGRGLVERLGELTQALLWAAVDAYIDGDAMACDRLAPVFAGVVNVRATLVDHLLECARQSKVEVDAAVQFAIVARCYERAADHALAIAQRVRYLVTGNDHVNDQA